jgi:polyisoprenoid-binding protein YceI
MQWMRSSKKVMWFVLACATSASGAPETYDVDPGHTFPSFEADHMGISIWRGKVNQTSGKVVLDRASRQGRVEAAIDLASVDFGHDKLNRWATSEEFFDVAKYPTARYSGNLEAFVDGKPTRVKGELSLHGVTKPVSLTINSFNCVPHPLLRRELCGADATGTFNRDEFGLTAGKDYGFRMDVTLRIQVEAVKSE